MDFITSNYTDLIQIITGIVTTASIITGLTKTPKDDDIIATLYKVIEFFAFVTPKAKE